MKKLFKNNKRRGVFSQMHLVIIAVAAILIFAVFLYKAYDDLADKMAVKDCKNSITAHSLIARGSFSEIFTDIKCPTREITIKKLNKANEIIAEDMHRCWYIWGQGQGQYFEGDGTFCHICAVYQFGDKEQEVTGLYEYLMKTNVPVTYAGETPGIKYIDYFQGYTSPNADRKVDEVLQVPIELDTINTSERYATIFVYASGKDAVDKILENGGRTTGITGLAMFGTAGTLGATAAAKIGMAAAGGAAASTAATGGATGIVIATTEVSILTATGATASQVAAVSSITTTGGIIVPVTSATGQAILAGSAATGGAVTGGAATAGTVASGAVLGITPIGWTAIGVGVLALAGVGVYMLLDVPDPEWVSYIAFRPYNVDELKALGCEKMVVNQMSNVGTP